jgi:cyanate lyase
MKRKKLNRFVVQVTIVLETEARTPQEAVELITAKMNLDPEQVSVLAQIGTLCPFAGNTHLN